MWTEDRALIQALVSLARSKSSHDGSFLIAWRDYAYGANDMPLTEEATSAALEWLEALLARGDHMPDNEEEAAAAWLKRGKFAILAFRSTNATPGYRHGRVLLVDRLGVVMRAIGTQYEQGAQPFESFIPWSSIIEVGEWAEYRAFVSAKPEWWKLPEEAELVWSHTRGEFVWPAQARG